MIFATDFVEFFTFSFENNALLQFGWSDSYIDTNNYKHTNKLIYFQKSKKKNYLLYNDVICTPREWSKILFIVNNEQQSFQRIPHAKKHILQFLSSCPLHLDFTTYIVLNIWHQKEYNLANNKKNVMSVEWNALCVSEGGKETTQCVSQTLDSGLNENK